MHEKAVLRAPDVCALLNIQKPTFYRWIRIGHFPRGVRYGPRVVGWPREVVEKWFAEKQTSSFSK